MEDIEICMNYKKTLHKIFALNNDFPNIKLIIVGNFDLTKSELNQLFDFSGFISIGYPSVTRNMDSLRDIISKKLDINSNSNQIEILNQCLGNFSHNFANLNQYIFAIKENYDEIFNHNFNYINDLMNNLNQLSLTYEVEIFKSKKKIDFIKEQEIEEFMDEIKLDLFQDNPPSVKQSNKQIKEKIQNISSISPINIKCLNQKEIEFSNKLHHSSQNLSESLSRAQKIILLSSFFASESSAKADSVIFKSVKRTKRRNRTKVITFSI
jgi:hypothetical protein